jgi:hypothetical protein
MSTLDDKASDNPMLGEMGEKGNHQVYENEIVRMYLKATEIVDEEDIDITLFTEDDKEGIITEDGI